MSLFLIYNILLVILSDMMLNSSEEQKYIVIEKIEKKTITRKEGSIKLGLSLKQIDRLRKIFREQGKEGFVHGNRGKISEKKINDSIIEELKQLYITEFFDYNLIAFYEEITENKKYKGKYNISYSSLYTAFLYDDIISPLAHKETIKLYLKKMNTAIQAKKEVSQEKIDLFETRQIKYNQAHIRRSSNQYDFGQEVQMDACEKYWFGDIITYLHLAIDKATKKVLFGWFEYEELTRGYFVLLYNIIINYGIPEKIKTDNRNSFSNQDNKTDTTQFGIICNMLNINLVTTSVSTAKANVERENKTFKDRLIAELRHEGITNNDEANKYLNEIFIPKMNKKFSYEINFKTSRMKTNNYSKQELNLIISEKYTRIIDNASSIKFDNKYYIPYDSETGEIVCFKRKTESKLIITYNGEYWCEIENKYYQLMEIEKRSTTMKKEKENNKPLEKKKYDVKEKTLGSAPNPEV